LLSTVTLLAATLALWRQMWNSIALPEAYLCTAITGFVTALAPLAVYSVSAFSRGFRLLTIRDACYAIAPFVWWLVFVYALLQW
jgi:hypothetical protein